MSAYDFPPILAAAVQRPIRLQFASTEEANRYKWALQNWRRSARKRREPTHDTVSIYQREALVILATKPGTALVPELAGKYPEPVAITGLSDEEDEFLNSLNEAGDFPGLPLPGDPE